MTAKPLFIVAFLITNFGHSQTIVDYDTKTDFSVYTSYAWIAPGDSVLNRPRKDKLFGETILHFANAELKKRGLVVDTSSPGVLFMFSTKVEDDIRYSQSPTLSVGIGVAGPGYYVGGSAPVAGGKITSSLYHDGTLVFDMYDTKTGNLLWRGGTTEKYEDQDDITKLIEEAVRKILKKLPKKFKVKR